jgi:hypothetical protein
MIMKKSIMTLLGIAMAAATAMAAPLTDDDRAIKYEQLPVKARTFITNHFPNEQPSYMFEDRDLAHTEYKVMLESGVKIEFDGTGEWNDVECRSGAVPADIVPKKIADYVAKKYPANKIVEISRDHNDWEVKLNGGLELTFNRDYRLVDVDD